MPPFKQKDPKAKGLVL